MAETQKTEVVETKTTEKSSKKYVLGIICTLVGLLVGFVGTDLSNVANSDLVNIADVPTNPTEQQIAYAQAVLNNAAKAKAEAAKNSTAEKISTTIADKTGVEVSTSSIINLFNKTVDYVKSLGKSETK